jgi:hypothetical protein
MWDRAICLVIGLLFLVGCESQQDAKIRYCKEHDIPYTLYTSPTTDWEQRTRNESNQTGVPLGEVRDIYGAEGRAAALQTLHDK